jgi:hypothetical protein
MERRRALVSLYDKQRVIVKPFAVLYGLQLIKWLLSTVTSNDGGMEMEFVTLNNGAKMPMEGFGVFQMPEGRRQLSTQGISQ